MHRQATSTLHLGLVQVLFHLRQRVLRVEQHAFAANVRHEALEPLTLQLLLQQWRRGSCVAK